MILNGMIRIHRNRRTRGFRWEPIFQSGFFGRGFVALCLCRFMLVFLTDLHLPRRIRYDDARMDGRIQQALALRINNGVYCPMNVHSHLNYTRSWVIAAGRLLESFGNEDQMDARLLMSGMTFPFCHPRRSVAGIHPKKARMDSRLPLSEMINFWMEKSTFFTA